MAYNADAVRAYFDDFADKEWSRLEATVQARSSYAIHHRILSRYAQPTMRVLDIGSGPGRFAIDLARAGCRVTLGDISPIQLDLARQQIQKAGLLERVDDFRQIDVTDLAALSAARCRMRANAIPTAYVRWRGSCVPAALCS